MIKNLLVSLFGFNGSENAPKEYRENISTGHPVSNYQPHFLQNNITNIIDNLLAGKNLI